MLSRLSGAVNAHNVCRDSRGHLMRSPITDYIDRVVQPSIENANALKELSRNRYLASLKFARQELAGYSIHDGTRFRVLEKSLQAIEQRKRGSASSARTVLSKYLVTQLIRDGLLDGNPLKGVSIDLGDPETKSSQGRRTLTETEWDTVVKHLLTRGVEPLLMPTKTQEHPAIHAHGSHPSSPHDPLAGCNWAVHQRGERRAMEACY